jgi:putative transcriptional regulator
MSDQNEDASMKPYQYLGCGLPNVYLTNGVKETKTPYGPSIVINDVEGLHGAIADQLVVKASALTPVEFRFLRSYLELSQKKLGELVGTSDQSIANWEKGNTAIVKSAETLLRMLVREHRGGNVDVRQFVERVNEDDRQERLQSLTFKQSKKTWRFEAAAA